VHRNGYEYRECEKESTLKIQRLLTAVVFVVSLLGSSMILAAPVGTERVSEDEQAKIDEVRNLVISARVLLASDKHDEAVKMARNALSSVEGLQNTSETEALRAAAMDVVMRCGRPVSVTDEAARSELPGTSSVDAGVIARAKSFIKNMKDRRPNASLGSDETRAAIQELMQQIERDRVPQSRLVELPEYPSKLKMEEPLEDLNANETLEDWEREIATKLEQRVSFEFEQAALGDVVDYLQEFSGTNIILDPRVGADERTITLKVKDMQLSCALKWLARMSQLSYTVRGESVFISTPEFIDGESVIRVYDVADLTMEVRDFWRSEPPDGGLDADNAEGIAFTDVLPEEYRAQSEEAGIEWADFIRNSIAPASWSEETGGRSLNNTISYRAGQLVVNNTVGVHRQIQKMLDAFRAARALQVSIQTRFIDVRDDFVEKFNFDWIGDPASDEPSRMVRVHGGYPDEISAVEDGQIPAGFQSREYGLTTPSESPPILDVKPNSQWQAALENLHDVTLSATEAGGITGAGGMFLNLSVISDYQAHLLISAVHKTQLGSVLVAPQVMCFNTQRANIVIADTIDYVSALSSAQEPEIGTVTDGVILEVQPFVSADRRYITIELRPSLNQLVQFTTKTYSTTVDAISTNQSKTTFRTIQVPEISRRSIQSTVVVPDGGTLMVGGMSRSSKRTGMAGVPFLSQLPVVGRVFKSDAAVDRKRSLVILVKADVILQDEEMAAE